MVKAKRSLEEIFADVEALNSTADRLTQRISRLRERCAVLQERLSGQTPKPKNNR